MMRPSLSLLLIAITTSGLFAEQSRYRVEFDAAWSASTHPIDFPPTAHFSTPVGATHNAGVEFWAPGGIATDGIERMAERGGTSLLEDEVRAAITDGTADQVILGNAIFSPDSTVFEFDIDSDYSLVTLVTMIAPSPDWFVGVHGLNLRAGGEWIPSITIPLDPYDAGTDSAPSFNHNNTDTSPREPITRITGFPFTGTASLGTFTFTQVPEPTTLAMLLTAALGGLILTGLRRLTNLFALD